MTPSPAITRPVCVLVPLLEDALAPVGAMLIEMRQHVTTQHGPVASGCDPDCVARAVEFLDRIGRSVK